MRRAIASLLSFAGSSLYAPIFADGLAGLLAPSIAAVAGYAGARLVLAAATLRLRGAAEHPKASAAGPHGIPAGLLSHGGRDAGG